MIKINELLIANGQLVAETLRHLANNEIDSDYFAVTSECESYGTEVDCEFAITDYARQAAVTVDQLVAALEAAERERDELRGKYQEVSGWYAKMKTRMLSAENELGRRDAAAGEPVVIMSVSKNSSDDFQFEIQKRLPDGVYELYTAAPPAVLPTEKITEIMQDAWNEFCDDTGCYPDDFEYQNEQLFFDAGRWAMMVAERISSLGAQQQNNVQLPMPFDVAINLTRACGDIEYRYHESGEHFDRDEILAVLDAANVKYEVKK